MLLWILRDSEAEAWTEEDVNEYKRNTYKAAKGRDFR